MNQLEPGPWVIRKPDGLLLGLHWTRLYFSSKPAIAAAKRCDGPVESVKVTFHGRTGYKP